jgi:3',5'-cyclic AMP phosphodiesterase CpdA
MQDGVNRRDFLKLAGIAGVAFSAALGGTSSAARAARRGAKEFYFLQMSDTHVGFADPKINPEAAVTLERTVATVNELPLRPDFIVFTGDLSHTTDDPAERRRRMTRFRDAASKLKVKDVHFLPGEHDASLDGGEAFREMFGWTHYAFDHEGIHFIALDNVSDPTGSLGDAQLEWLRSDLSTRDKHAPIVVLTHRPLFDLAADWDWTTRDGDKAIALLEPFETVTVFYGHIHQENHHTTGHIAHHAAKSLVFPLPAPHSVPKKAPIPWDAQHPFNGLGFRTVEVQRGNQAPELREWPAVKG